MEHVKLIASEGMILTNGEIYGREVYIGTGDSPDNWHEIPDAEYEVILAEEQAKLEAELGVVPEVVPEVEMGIEPDELP